MNNSQSFHSSSSQSDRKERSEQINKINKHKVLSITIGEYAQFKVSKENRLMGGSYRLKNEAEGSRECLGD